MEAWLSICRADLVQRLSVVQVHSYRNPVLFTSAAAQIPDNAFVLEIGPHSILRSPIRQCRPGLKYVGAMRKGACGVETLTAAVGELWRAGVPVHWKVGRAALSESLQSVWDCSA